MTADDFGLSPGVVAGIVEAHERGIVTATSLMVSAPAADEAYREARAHPELSCGLHFVLTFGAPVGPAEALGDLVDEAGRFRRLESGAHATTSSGRARVELRAQLARFRDGVGRPPTHIDGHHHIHTQPGILRAVIEEAGQLGISVRATDAALRERFRLERIRTEDAFIDAFYAEGERAVDVKALVAILESLPDGTSELMCHPAKPDDVLASLSSYVSARYDEFRTLTSPEVRRALESRGIELVGR